MYTSWASWLSLERYKCTCVCVPVCVFRNVVYACMSANTRACLSTHTHNAHDRKQTIVLGISRQCKNCKLCRGHPEERTVQGFAGRSAVTRNGTRVQLDRIPPTREHLGESPVMFFLVGDLGTGIAWDRNMARPAAWK